MIDDLRGVARDLLSVAARRPRDGGRRDRVSLPALAVFAALLPVVLGLVVSTLYLRMHYAVDLVAARRWAPPPSLLAPLINRRWAARWERRNHNSPEGGDTDHEHRRPASETEPRRRFL
jgi:membrane-associated phospholipid phosphatase